ncbi:MAG: hypothetical protein COW30_11425 [Rhodospirillales bacterium CG15_BIG_FIL_POST_REV_8_21_14_020_66_15]|nr:MAG: hypothetical protein COW30_11425 [Rhodospirillales bacterium CG15_BIG_FIL_POST_REV_8_21_14_020_66_15]
MEELEYFDDEDTAGTVFRDVILLALIGFVAMVVMLLPHLQPPQEQREEAKAPGNVMVEVHWPNDMPYDVDLWVKAPGERPVGFWNQSGFTFNLLRDDLGIEGDATDRNYEMSYSRGIPAGEYVVNVHMYGHLPKDVRLPVRVVVSVKRPLEEPEQVAATTVELRYKNQEETAFRFRLDGEGRLVEGSVSKLRKPLITELR